MKPIQQLKYPGGYDVVEVEGFKVPEGVSKEDEKKHIRKTFEVVQASVVDDILDKISELVNRVNKLG